MEQMKHDGEKAITAAVQNREDQLRRASGVENDRLRQKVTSLQRDLRAEQAAEDKLREEAKRLKAQNEQIGRGRDEARKQLQTLREEVLNRSQEIKTLSNKLQEQQRVNEGLRKELAGERARAAAATDESDQLKQKLRKVHTDLVNVLRRVSRLRLPVDPKQQLLRDLDKITSGLP
jgi:chromosome segregation ATPase